MTGWEETNDFVTFRLVRQEGTHASFSGLTFRRHHGSRSTRSHEGGLGVGSTLAELRTFHDAKAGWVGRADVPAFDLVQGRSGNR